MDIRDPVRNGVDRSFDSLIWREHFWGTQYCLLNAVECDAATGFKSSVMGAQAIDGNTFPATTTVAHV
eukprot:SAG31_NODE_6243_length_2105_cov_1.939681_1_plen_67_part_10